MDEFSSHQVHLWNSRYFEGSVPWLTRFPISDQQVYQPHYEYWACALYYCCITTVNQQWMLLLPRPCTSAVRSDLVYSNWVNSNARYILCTIVIWCCVLLEREKGEDWEDAWLWSCWNKGEMLLPFITMKKKGSGWETSKLVLSFLSKSNQIFCC